ncbi:N-acetyltransferase ESCO2-like [Atheta coriaria]|uniref:N-acetyltransferase ESCO2-like n=1 Tax=Dalotia coriaria TaxID=877792 RepID=UPI0031F33F79
MATTTQSTSQTKYEHTEKISARRKALFPTGSDSGSDLGHMSPIHSESSNFSENAFTALEHEADHQFRKFFKCSLTDYVLLEDDAEILTPDPCSETSVPPLYLSPMQTLLSTPILYSPMHTTKIVTPLSKSPSSTLKTPHDTSTVKVNQKQTKRKLVTDTKNDPQESQSPNSKQAKFDSKSKVRTALFPEDEIVLPVKTFYPKENNTFNVKESISALLAASKHRVMNVPHVKRAQIKNTAVLTLNKRRYGEINAGVRHKIRKPKQKKVTQAKIVKATMKIIEKSPLTEYLEEMTNVKKTIKPLPLNSTINNTSNKKNNSVNMSDTLANRKFFKTLRSSFKQVIGSPKKQPLRCLNKTKEALQPNKRKLDVAEFEFSPEKDVAVVPEVDNLINQLDKEVAKTTANPNLIFSPTAQMCNMASALDLNSPKRAKVNISKMLNDSTLKRPNNMTSYTEKVEKSAKLFPLFCADKNKSMTCNTNQKEIKKGPTHAHKKFKTVSDNQLLIDAGQKKFGAIVCHECSFVYESGDASDEMIHRTYHEAINTFKFNGWKNERVVTNIDVNTRIIKIIPGDMKIWWKKGVELIDYINREMGFYDMILPLDKSQMYLYVQNKKIIGCLTAEMKQTAYKRLPTDLDIDLCSEEAFQVRCGISRVWVAPHHRRAGIATQLMDTLRRNFLHGYFLQNNEIAISSPSDLGQKFASKYFQTDSFLIYMN